MLLSLYAVSSLLLLALCCSRCEQSSICCFMPCVALALRSQLFAASRLCFYRSKQSATCCFSPCIALMSSQLSAASRFVLLSLRAVSYLLLLACVALVSIQLSAASCRVLHSLRAVSYLPLLALCFYRSDQSAICYFSPCAFLAMSSQLSAASHLVLLS